MTETSVRPDPGPSQEDALEVVRGRLVATVAGVPGVVRIEHTLSGAVRAISLDDDPRSAIRVTSRRGVVDVELSIAARADHQARRLAHELQQRIRRTITDHDLTPGSLEINVLAIER